MKRMSILVGILIFAAGFLFANGSSEKGATPSGSIKGAHITWATFIDANEFTQGQLQDLVAKWEKETGATVKLSVLPGQEIASKVTVDQAAGANTYDLFTMNFPFIGQFAQAGQLIDLDKYINDPKARQTDIKDFIPRLLQIYGKWDGKLYAFPLSADGRVLAYRTDLMSKSEVPTTWEQYIAIAKKFNGKDLNGDGKPDFGTAVRIAGDTIAAGRFLEVFGGEGGVLLNKNWMPGIDTEAGRKAFQVYRELLKYSPPDTLSYGYADYTNMFLQGRVPELVLWASAAGSAISPKDSKVSNKVAFAPVPGGSPLLGGWSIAGLSSTKHPLAVYDFMAWLTSKKVEMMRWTNGNRIYPPTRLSTLGNPELVKQYPYWPALMTDFEHSQALPRIPEASAMIQVFGQDIQRALSNEITVDAALKDSQQKWEAILRKAGYLK